VTGYVVSTTSTGLLLSGDFELNTQPTWAY
jgi:hypothetical protein